MSDCTVSWHNRSWEHIRKAPKSENGPTEKEHQKFLDDNDTGIVGRSTPAQTISAGATILFGLGFLFNINSDNNFLKGGSGLLAVVSAIATGIFTFGKGWKLTEASGSSKPNPKPSDNPTDTKGAGETNKPDSKPPSPEEEAFDPTNKKSVMKKLDSFNLDRDLLSYGHVPEDSEAKLMPILEQCNPDQITAWLKEDLSVAQLKEYDHNHGSRYALLAIVDKEALDAVPELLKLLDIDKKSVPAAHPELESEKYEVLVKALAFRYENIERDERIVAKFEEIISDVENNNVPGPKSPSEYSAGENRFEMRKYVAREAVKIPNEYLRAAVIDRLKDDNEVLSLRTNIAYNLMPTVESTDDIAFVALEDLLRNKDTAPRVRETIIGTLISEGPYGKAPRDKDVYLGFVDIVKDIEDTKGVLKYRGVPVSSDLVRCKAEGTEYDSRVDRLVLKDLMDSNVDPEKRAKIASDLMSADYANRPDVFKILYDLFEDKGTDGKIVKAMAIKLLEGQPQDRDILLEFASIMQSIEEMGDTITPVPGKPLTSDYIRECAESLSDKE